MKETGNPGGGYILVLEVANPTPIPVGKLGVLGLHPGRYYYGGSARRGMTGRVARHFRRTKNVYWHIDYLTVHPEVTLPEVWCYPGRADVEHLLPDLEEVETEGIPHKLGAGDCTRGCHSHLVRGIASVTPDMIAPDYYVLDADGHRTWPGEPDGSNA